MAKDELSEVKRNEAASRRRLLKYLEEIKDNLLYYGVRVESTAEELPTVRRKPGCKLLRRDWEYRRCPSCRAGSRIWYKFTEFKPWDRLTEYQCGFCGHEWSERDNTYD